MSEAHSLRVALEENDRLRAELHDLKKTFFGDASVPPEWRLTTSEAKIMGLLIARPEVAKEQLFAALYSDRIGDPPDILIVSVFVCNLRKKMQAHDIDIKTRWGIGFYLDPATRARCAAMSGRQVAA